MRSAPRRRTPALLLLAALALATTVATAPSAGACSCIDSDLGTQIRAADTVFIAEPVSARSIDEQAEVAWTMTVREVLAGEAPIIATVVTSNDEAGCGRQFQPGERVTVVAFEGPDGLLETTLCVSSDETALRAAAIEAGFEPHEPVGVPPQKSIVVGGEPASQGVGSTPVADSVEDDLVLIRALAALVAVLLSIALVSVLVRDDAD